jgi:hypothetical protein
MGRRLVLLSTLVLAGAMLLMPASVAAAEGFHHKIVHNFCQGLDPHFKVRNIAAGWTNANKLTNETWVERRPSGGSWKTIYSWPRAKYTFTINGDQHWLTSWRRWDGDREYWYRIGFRLRAWHNSTLLSSTVVYSVKC